MSISLLYLLSGLLAAAVSFAVSLIDSVNAGDAVITVLAFSCFFLLDFLVKKSKYGKKLSTAVCAVGVFVAYFFFHDANLIFVTSFLILDIIEQLTEGRYYYQISAVTVLLMIMILSPSQRNILILAATIGFFILARVSIESLLKCRRNLTDSRYEISELKRKISNQNSYIKTLKESSALEERSRFAVRIHDQLGHGISGSIILLEAAKLNIKSNPEQAEKCIETVTDSLRRSVDEIRMSLRQERPDAYEIGISDIKAVLNKFKADYGIDTDFSITGDVEKIAFPVWKCINENLNEALTNTLKHSNSSKFSLSISIMNKIIRAEFKDNGGATEIFKKGTGLSAIEERTVLAKGRCVFLSQADGFHIINIFNL